MKSTQRTNITKIMETETGHRLTTFPHRCAHLHGHRYVWEVTVTAPTLDEVGFVMDYSDLKQILKHTVDQLDHAFVFHDRDPLILFCDDNGVPSILDATNGDEGRIHIVPFNPTSENLVPWIGELIQNKLPPHIELKHIRMWEASNSYCDWTPAIHETK